MFSPSDHQFMRQALDLASLGLFTTDPNPRVGCLIVQNETVVGEGWHLRAGEAHAEVHALARAGEFEKGQSLMSRLNPARILGVQDHAAMR